MCKALGGRGTPSGFPMVQRHGLTSNLSNAEFMGIQLFAKSGDPSVSDECLDFLLHWFCLQASPPCNQETGLPMLICESSCEMIKSIQEKRICSNVDEHLRALYEVTLVENFRIIADAYFSFDCSDPADYYFMNVTHPDSESCTNFFSPQMECK